MKNFLRKLTSPFRHLWVNLTLLAVGILCLAGAFCIPHAHYDAYGTGTDFEYIWCAAISPDHTMTAVYDDTGRVYVLSGNNYRKVSYVLDFNSEASYHNPTVAWLSFDADNQLYLLLDENAASGYHTVQHIFRYGSDGTNLGEIVRYDYTNLEAAARDTSSIVTMGQYDGTLCYVYYEDDESRFSVYRVEPTTNNRTLLYMFEDLGFLYSTIKLSGDGTCSAVSKDGTAYLMDAEGKLTEYALSDVQVEQPDSGRLISNAIWNGRNLYINDSLTDDMLLSADEESVELMCYTSDIYPYYGDSITMGEETHRENVPEAEEDEGIFDTIEAFLQYNDEGMITDFYYANANELLFSVDNTLYYADTDSATVTGYCGFQIPSGALLIQTLLWILGICGALLSLLGLVCTVGCLMGWHFTLLSKQLFVIIPVLLAMLLVITASMLGTVRQSYYDNVEQELVDISEIILSEVDGEQIAGIRDLGYVFDGRYDQLKNLILKITGNNTSSLSQTYDIAIYRTSSVGDYHYRIASSQQEDQPFYGYLELDFKDMEDYLHQNSNTYIIDMYSASEEWMTAQTPIYDSQGNMAGVLELSADLDEYDSLTDTVLKKMGIQALIFMMVVILTIIIITYLNTRRLKQASEAVTKIAGGDFSTRITKKYAKDEVGAICEGVNNMAGQLETYFAEMERNEQFYYKFVPEQFKELLHKEAFTDLSLGDAESLDLTVLFCDIRSFSLNSEMMTARENFEFVNTIYGIAGPIVRNHNGFVDKYIGDAVMALFKNADDAINAGIDLYREIAQNPKTAALLGIDSIDIGIGIHSGMARIGIVGETERMSGTVISDTVNMSSRLESLTKQYKTAMIITKDTLDRMANPDRLNVRYLGMVQVAGVNEVKALYEVLDSLDEQRRTARMANVHEFREAVRLFHLGNCSGAMEKFRSLRAVTNSELDPVPNKYMTYIEEYLASGDTNHNVFRFSRK